MTKIPVAMATQHPDSASRYIPGGEEPEEALICLKKETEGGYGCDECKPDYEGKLTPYQQLSQIVMMLIDAGMTPGEDVYITPRIPSAILENSFRQIMSLMAVTEANAVAEAENDIQAIKEVVHPMTCEIKEVLKVRKRIEDVTGLGKKELGLKSQEITVIPLLEEVPALLKAYPFVNSFLDLYPERGHIRIFVGKSDAAMLYSHLASVLAIKVCLSDLKVLEEERSTEIAPIFGGGSLPFRGHITPGNVKNFMKEYEGVRTVTIQSGLRYDYGREECVKVIKELKECIPGGKLREIEREEREKMREAVCIFAKNYFSTFLKIEEVVSEVARIIPSQRDRLIARGPMKYVREAPDVEALAKLTGDNELSNELLRMKIGKKISLPRAISFTATMYTVGVPPTIIGTGRGLEEVKKRLGSAFQEKLICELYPSLESDLKFDFQFVDLKNARKFIDATAIKEIATDIEILADYFDLPAEGDKPHKMMASMVNSYILLTREGLLNDTLHESTSQLVKKMGEIRGSLG